MKKAAIGEGEGKSVTEGGKEERRPPSPALEVLHSLSAWEEEMEWGYFCTTFDAATQVLPPPRHYACVGTKRYVNFHVSTVKHIYR